MVTAVTPRAGLILVGLGAGFAVRLRRPGPRSCCVVTVDAAGDHGPFRTDRITGGPQGEQLPGTAEPRVATKLVGFRSPSSNVGCYLDVDYVRCDIAETDWSPPPRPADCEYDYGQGITLVPGGRAEFVCAGDTTLVPDGTALAYGQSISVGVLQCDSAEWGITCRDIKTGRGFAIAHEAYRVF
jgi:hypothetical protein